MNNITDTQESWKQGEARLKKLERQDRTNREIAKRAEPLIAKLQPGKNYFTPDQFTDIVNYLYPFDEEAKREKALSTGTLKPGSGIEIVRAKWIDKNKMVSLADLAHATGVPRKTLADCAARHKLCRQKSGNKYLYNIDELRAALCATATGTTVVREA